MPASWLNFQPTLHIHLKYQQLHLPILIINFTRSIITITILILTIIILIIHQNTKQSNKLFCFLINFQHQFVMIIYNSNCKSLDLQLKCDFELNLLKFSDDNYDNFNNLFPNNTWFVTKWEEFKWNKIWMVIQHWQVAYDQWSPILLRSTSTSTVDLLEWNDGLKIFRCKKKQRTISTLVSF